MRTSSWTRFAVGGVVAALTLMLLVPAGPLAAEDEAQPSFLPQVLPTGLQTELPPGFPHARATTHLPPAPGALLAPGSPPAVGALILQDPLNAPGVIASAAACPQTGHNSGDFTPDGYLFIVNGRCGAQEPNAYITPPLIAGLDLSDGEIRVEGKIVSGHQRAALLLLFRARPDPWHTYSVLVHPANGTAQLLREEVATVYTLASRSDLAGRASLDGWNSLAVRMSGSRIWIMLNDQPILSAVDAMAYRGQVTFGAERTGNPDDTTESAILYRNLRISELASN